MEPLCRAVAACWEGGSSLHVPGSCVARLEAPSVQAGVPWAVRVPAAFRSGDVGVRQPSGVSLLARAVLHLAVFTGCRMTGRRRGVGAPTAPRFLSCEERRCRWLLKAFASGTSSDDSSLPLLREFWTGSPRSSRSSSSLWRPLCTMARSMATWTSCSRSWKVRGPPVGAGAAGRGDREESPALPGSHGGLSKRHTAKITVQCRL